MDIKNEWEKYSNGVGRKILAKYGFKGKGLGKNEDGIAEPIVAHKRPIDRGGLDYNSDAIKRQATEPIRTFSTTIDFAKSKEDSNSSSAESSDEDESPILEVLPPSPSVPDASPIQFDMLESQVEQIKLLINNMVEKYSLQPIPLPEHLSFAGLNTVQADAKASQLTSVLNILHNFTETSSDELDFEQITEIDNLISNKIPDLYKKLAIDQYLFLILFPYFEYQVSNWNFLESLPEDISNEEESDMCLAYLQVFRDQFKDWKNFVNKKLSFQNHHLWNKISQSIIEKLNNFIMNENFNLKNSSATKFLVKLLAMWLKVMPSAINIEHQMAEKIQQEVASVKLDEVSRIHSWIVPWVNFLGQETMESVLIAVYSKLNEVFSRNSQNIQVEDFSIIQTLLPWKRTLTTFLYQKLLNTYIVPMLRKSLQNLEINPSNQELLPLWPILQWFELFTGSYTTLDIYVKVFEDEFFEKWLNILFTWLSSPKCNYEECVLWYKGWKEFFENNANELYLHVYANFNNAVTLMDTLLTVKNKNVNM